MPSRLGAILTLRGDVAADRTNLRRWFVVFLVWMAVAAGLACWGLAIEQGHPVAGRLVWLLSIYAFYLSLCNTYCPLPTAWIAMLLPSDFIARFVGLGDGHVAERVLATALVGGVATMMANLNEYHLTTWLLRLGRIRDLRQRPLYQIAVRWFDRAAFAALLVVAFIPLPVDVIRWLAIVRQYPRRRFAAAYLLGRGSRYALLAMVSVGLSLKVWHITAIQAGLVLVAALTLFVRWLRRR